jgi:hypothetical protein
VFTTIAGTFVAIALASPRVLGGVQGIGIEKEAGSGRPRRRLRRSVDVQRSTIA